MRIVFMGTPQFAVYALQALNESEHDVVGVVTSVDKPAGRGKQLRQSAVKEYAVAEKLHLLQPENLKDSAFTKELEFLNADVFIIVAFRMLPKTVWSIPLKGTFNLHASLLPNYRGSAPINWAIINNETITGATTFYIDDKIDTGAILLKEELAIEPTETIGSLHDKLAPLGANLILKTLDYIATNPTPKPQLLTGDEKEAPKLTKENTKIDWKQSLKYIDGLVRGLNPYPVAWLEIQTGESVLKVKIFKAIPIVEKHTLRIGNVFIEDKKIKIVHKEGILIVEELQLPNKKRMHAQALLNGFTFENGAEVL
jgi:methionyl-tRNA formyltransferase